MVDALMTRFAGVGLASFALDFAILWLIQLATGDLLLAVVVARLVSGSANFMANRVFVFRARSLGWRRSALRYAALAGVILVANYALLSTLTVLGLNSLVAKCVTEATLFCVSYVVQRLVVFAKRSSPHTRLRQESIKVNPHAVQISLRASTTDPQPGCVELCQISRSRPRSGFLSGTPCAQTRWQRRICLSGLRFPSTVRTRSPPTHTRRRKSSWC